MLSFSFKGTSSPQSLKKILSLSEEASERHRKQTEDSSQLSSPPTSPQNSPRKGYAGTADHLSDSGHSEISSRSSLVSNSSFDLAQDDRRQRNSANTADTHLGGARTERRATLDLDQYSIGSYSSMQEVRNLYTGVTVLSSPSSEELTHDQGDRASLDAADSGRGSWTSCSSGSHDSIQTIQHQRSWETLAFGHPHYDGPGEGAGLWAPGGGATDMPGYPEHGSREGRGGQELGQARGSWASSTLYWGEDTEGDTGTIKRRGGKDVNADPETLSITSSGSEEQPSPPSHITVSCSNAKGLISRREGRFREPPPTPPGYTALTLPDFAEAPPHTGRRPPDYNMALQRSRMVAHSCDSPLPPPHAGPRPQWSRSTDTEPPRLPHAPPQAAPPEDEGESASPKLMPLRRAEATPPNTSRP
ncbi:hypothetical protein SKAU_G00428630 [Synaphobranchus kaupii]|uniref:Uncharacterized protein n=1 Tax=Synaphobranchus kaupii TaxID=118154 RepID=A0A9Q1I899_SYNKA|nr:hypothetical protein SKAU_G00428630 [Synaphobranchus kaupii]